MKLTNISLAILVALGLAACGGSDDKNDQTTDPKKTTPIKKEEGPKETPTTTTPPKSGLDPERVAPDLTLPEDMKGIVNATKRVFVNRSFSDPALGYSNGKASGLFYDSDKGTDPENIKLTSVYNYSEENDLITSVANGYGQKAVGAISVGDDPSSKNNNTFVMIKPGQYVRVATDNVDAAGFDKKTKFYAIDKDGNLDKSKEYDQDKVVFIANAKTDNNSVGVVERPLELGTYKLKNTATPATPPAFYQYDNKGQVLLKSVNVFGKEYSASTVGQNLDFSVLDPKHEIQKQKVIGNYDVVNSKGNNSNNGDDKIVSREATLGYVKAYNLPYSIALVTTNVDEKNPAPKDIFNLQSAFQVLGSKTVALPQNGRTFYKGKAFSANTTGDVTLFADLFEDRAGIHGVVENRKDHKGKDLATLTLDNADFAPGNKIFNTFASGSVTGDPNYVNGWTVQLYGPDAEEAAGGLIYDDGNNNVTVKEVYNTQRQGLTNKSNTADTK